MCAGELKGGGTRKKKETWGAPGAFGAGNGKRYQGAVYTLILTISHTHV